MAENDKPKDETTVESGEAGGEGEVGDFIDDLLADVSTGDEAEPEKIGDARKLYHAKYRELTVEEREALAKSGDEKVRAALAHDPLPRVITSLMENPNFSVVEARIIAREHPSGQGLTLMCGRAKLLADPEVRRRLLKNGHATQGIIALVLRGRPLATIHQVGISHDVPENTKTFARSELRRAFGERSPDEKVALILKTEGRVLSLLVGVALDGRSISMIIARTAMSTMLIRSFAQWPTSPPPILAHMMKLPQVQRDKSLQQALMRHPNLPSALKRGG